MCRHTCSSTPITLTPSRRCSSSTRRSSPLGQDRVVRAVPRAAQRHGHAPDAHRVQHHRGDRPPHGRLRQPPPARAYTRQIILPRAAARPALVTTTSGQQVDPGLAQRRVDEPAPARAAHRRRDPAFPAQPRRLDRLAADLPHAAPASTRHMTLRHAPQPQGIQPQQHAPVEPAKLAYRPRGIFGYLLHNQPSCPTALPTPNTHENRKSR